MREREKVRRGTEIEREKKWKKERKKRRREANQGTSNIKPWRKNGRNGEQIDKQGEEIENEGEQTEIENARELDDGDVER